MTFLSANYISELSVRLEAISKLKSLKHGQIYSDSASQLSTTHYHNQSFLIESFKWIPYTFWGCVVLLLCSIMGCVCVHCFFPLQNKSKSKNLLSALVQSLRRNMQNQ